MLAIAAAVAISAALADAPPTFNGDIAPIFYSKCVTCHRTGEAAPMPLVTYEDARPWARAIKARVLAREMPPWFADPKVGRALANNASLTDAQIATIAAWVDAGAPSGTGTLPPRPPQPAIAAGWHSFKNRPPDAIIEMPIDFEIPAEGAVPVFTLWAPNPFAGDNVDKFIEAVELRPGAAAAVHHSDVTARTLPPGTVLGRGRAWKGGPLVDFVPVYPDGRSYNEIGAGELDAAPTVLRNETLATTDDNRLLFYVPGGGFQQFPAGAVKRISAGNVLAWSLHYTPTGKPERDRHRLGLWFAQAPHTHEVITKRIGEAHIIEGREFVAGAANVDFPVIPPYAGDWKITAITPFQDDVTVYGLWPHMHLRGKDMMFVATYPDGREEVLLNVPKYDFRWQLQYELAEPVHLPAGSTIKAIGHYDNSTRNKYNPGPGKPVYWSEQSWDEMFNGWMEISIDRHVIARNPKYTIAKPVNSRVSLGIGAGPAGTVYVRDRDGRVLASGPIGTSPSFIEPWTFAAGQTVNTEATGAGSGDVTLTLFDVPPDTTGTIAIDGRAVAVTARQPGQNGTLTFEGSASRRATVHVTGNRMREVTVKLLRANAAGVLASSTSSAGSFNLPAVTLPSNGTYVIVIDPVSMNVGSMNIAVTSRER